MLKVFGGKGREVNYACLFQVTRRSADPSSKKAVLVHKLTFEAQEGVKSCMNG
jgi:hypothetical protein